MEQRFSLDDIQNLERFDRVNLIHSIVGFKTPFLLGTMGDSPNLAVFSSIIHLGSNPPLIGIKFRPVGNESHTYKNILKTGLVSINAVNKNMYTKAHFTSVRIPENESEFEFSELTPEWKKEVGIPFVSESPLKMLGKLQEVLPIKSNNTHLMVIGIEWIEIDKNYMLEDGTVDLDSMEVVALNGLYHYHETQKLASLQYVHAPD
jgi:flavin reductase (DIM6/NTAB) family NADH-FMN oxidoreductase RutF